MTNSRLQWFKYRIGKKVFRANELDICECEACKSNKYYGVLISNDDHAMYLHMIEAETSIKYFDTKEEAEQYKGE